MSKKILQPFISGIVASIGLFGLYGLTMTLLSGWDAAVEQFFALWYLMVPLAVGFGVQVGLYTQLKHRYRVLKHGNKDNAVVTAGGVSGSTAMLACCVHHATDVLPLLGLSGLSIFLTQFQKPILLVSLGINIFGIFIMIKHLRQETVSKTLIILVSIAAFTILATWILIAQNASRISSATPPPVWETKENSGGNVTVAVTPITLRPLFPASFDVTFETHSVELDFAIENIVRLTDEKGTQYTPHWQGSPPGGHHRKGTLVFTPDIPKPTTVTLVFRDIAGVPSRTFSWNIKRSTGD